MTHGESSGGRSWLRLTLTRQRIVATSSSRDAGLFLSKHGLDVVLFKPRPDGSRTLDRNRVMATAEEAKGAPKQASDSDAVRSAAIVIIVVMSITALKIGRPVVLPVVIAV